MRRQRDNQEGEGAAEPPARSSRVAAPPVSSQESAHVPEEGMPRTCSDFPVVAFHGIDEVWCDSCGQKCTLDRVRAKSKTNGTYTTYQLVRRLNGDPTAATAEFYAAAAGKGMGETKKLWEHHADKNKVNEEINEEGGHFHPVGYWEAQGFPIKDILEKSLPQNVQPCRMFGTI